MQRLSFSLALVLLALAVAAPAAAQSDTATPTTAQAACDLLHHPAVLSKFLNLSTDQNTQFKTLWQTARQTIQPLRQARGPLCSAYQADITAPNPSPGQVGQDAIALFENKQAIRDAKQTFDTGFSAILDPTQLASYDTVKSLCDASHPDVFIPTGVCYIDASPASN